VGNSVGHITTAAAVVIPTVASARASRNMCGGYRYINRDRSRGALLSYALDGGEGQKQPPRASLRIHETCV